MEPTKWALLAGPPNYFFGNTAGVGLVEPPFEFEGIVVDSAGNRVVADSYNHTILRISPAGVVTTVAGKAGADAARVDGAGPQARFCHPMGLAIDPADNVYVGDTHCPWIGFDAKIIFLPVRGSIRKVAPDGTVTSVADFTDPRDVAIDGEGNLYVADQMEATLTKIAPSGSATTLAGRSGDHRIVDGDLSQARFDCPTGIAVDRDGNVYVSDTPATRLYPVQNPCLAYNAGPTTIRRIAPSGMVTTIDPGLEGWNYTAGLATDGAGNLYIADREHHVIRKRTPDGAVTTLVGSTANHGFIPGPLPGLIESPRGLAIRGGNLYFTLEYGVGFAYGPD